MFRMPVKLFCVALDRENLCDSLRESDRIARFEGFDITMPGRPVPNTQSSRPPARIGSLQLLTVRVSRREVSMTTTPAWAIGGEPVYKRDLWTCQYCGLDGKASFAAWQALTWDHLLPRGHHQRDVLEFIVTSCASCNTMLSRYVLSEDLPPGDLDSTAKSMLLEARHTFLKPRLLQRRTYWQSVVASPQSQGAA